jgi:tRNA pseudouridine32 synthase / 23S rRNA pseudouridine746 synthase
MTPEDVLSRVLYRDGLMLIIDKPAGLPVHRGPKGGASIEDYFDALRYGLPRPPALAHRLDKETSGCLVLGRHRKALAHLGLLFKHGKVGKTYWAVVEGGPEVDEGTIDLALGRLDETRGWWMKPDPKGLPSVTTWKVLGRQGLSVCSLEVGSTDAPVAQSLPPPLWGRAGEGGGQDLMTRDRGDPPPYPSPTRGEGTGPLLGERVHSASAACTSHLTWLALEPITGRTHQLRVHCAAMGWPIVGDNIYGTAPRFGGPGMHLHAREIVVPLSKNKPPVRVAAPLPAHMHERFKACGWNGEQQIAVAAAQ